jgi:trk system potassium uptake protein TrkA
MYIIIVGCGRLGLQLSKALLAVGHEVTAIEKDVPRYKVVNRLLGSVVMQGDGTSMQTLSLAGANRADLVVALTGSDESNLATCQMAKHGYNTDRTMALVKSPAHEALFRLLEVDTVINSTHLILTTIEEEVPKWPLIHLLNLKTHSMDIVAMPIPPDASIIGQNVNDIDLPPNSFISLVVKNDGPVIPKEDTIIETNDEVIVVTIPSEEQILYEKLTGVA